MGKELCDANPSSKELFAKSNEILGFRITDVMFNGTDEDLRQTKVTQPAVFLHSVITALTTPDLKPDMVAGHSLGEFSALVVSGAISFEAGVSLVSQRALAMQRACEINPGTMAAVIALPDDVVEEVCASITDGVVVPANYNCPGQLVISGAENAIDKACVILKEEKNAKRALKLVVGGAFHSPLMEPARQQLETAIAATEFAVPSCPIYQNVDAKPSTDPEKIKTNLIAQLTAPVRWTQAVQNMVADGADYFKEIGPGKVLKGLVAKIDKTVTVE